MSKLSNIMLRVCLDPVGGRAHTCAGYYNPANAKLLQHLFGCKYFNIELIPDAVRHASLTDCLPAHWHLDMHSAVVCFHQLHPLYDAGSLRCFCSPERVLVS